MFLSYIIPKLTYIRTERDNKGNKNLPHITTSFLELKLEIIDQVRRDPNHHLHVRLLKLFYLMRTTIVIIISNIISIILNIRATLLFFLLYLFLTYFIKEPYIIKNKSPSRYMNLGYVEKYYIYIYIYIYIYM